MHGQQDCGQGEELMYQDMYDLIYLSACAVNRRTADPVRAAAVDLDALFEAARFHQMTSIAASALNNAGVQDPRILPKMVQYAGITMNYDRERKRILDALEQAQIWYVPLKGAVLQEYYPQKEWRQMSDNDILFDAGKAEEVRKIMTSLGYACDRFDEGHRDDYSKPPVFHFEMHRVLFDEEMDLPRLAAYYRNVRKRLKKDTDRNYGYHFSNEDFYIFMAAHEYKHIIWGGAGLRALLDVYVFLQKFSGQLDWTYILGEIKKLGIQEYEEKNRILAMHVFSEGEPGKLTKNEKAMLEYYITSGVHGTVDHTIQNSARKLGVLRYILLRAFPPMETIKKTFPFFYRYRIFLPLLPFYRIAAGCRNAVRELLDLLGR